MWKAIKRKKSEAIAVLEGAKSVAERETCVGFFFLTPWGLYRSKLALRTDTAMVQGIQRAHPSWLFPHCRSQMKLLCYSTFSALLSLLSFGWSKTNSHSKSLVPMPLTQYLMYRFMCELIIYAFSSGKKPFVPQSQEISKLRPCRQWVTISPASTVNY